MLHTSSVTWHCKSTESSILVMCVLLLAANHIPRIASMESYDNLLCRLKAFKNLPKSLANIKGNYLASDPFLLSDSLPSQEKRSCHNLQKAKILTYFPFQYTTEETSSLKLQTTLSMAVQVLKSFTTFNFTVSFLYTKMPQYFQAYSI